MPCGGISVKRQRLPGARKMRIYLYECIVHLLIGRIRDRKLGAEGGDLGGWVNSGLGEKQLCVAMSMPRSFRIARHFLQVAYFACETQPAIAKLIARGLTKQRADTSPIALIFPPTCLIFSLIMTLCPARFSSSVAVMTTTICYFATTENQTASGSR